MPVLRWAVGEGDSACKTGVCKRGRGILIAAMMGSILCAVFLAAGNQPFWAKSYVSSSQGIIAAQCKSVASAPDVQTAAARNLLDRQLGVLMDPRMDSDARRRLAVYYQAQGFARRAEDKSAVFDQVTRDIGTGRLDRTVSALYDLEQLVLFTAQLRNRRADLTRIRFSSDGDPILTVRAPPTSPDLEVVTARAVVGLLESGGELGLDCSASELYADARTRAGIPATIPLSVMRQTDLQRLYDRIDAIHRSCVTGVAGGNTFLADLETISPQRVTQVTQETRAAFDKARDVLERAIDLYGTWLNEHLPGGIPERRTTGAVKGVQPAAPASTTSTSASLSSPSASPSPSVVTGPDTPTPEPGPSAGEVERDTFVADIQRQVEMLRRAQGGEAGGLATRPISTANNLHIRMKRLYRIAALVAKVGDKDGSYHCTLGAGAVDVTFEQQDGRLRQIRAVVTERFSEGVTLAWYVALSRQSDQDFTLESGIGGIGAYMEVQKGEPVRFPNYQQIIILMNRVDQLVEGARASHGPVNGPTE